MKLEDKILRGYAYRIGQVNLTKKLGDDRSLILNTGKGGVLMYIKECRKNHLPDAFIASGIEVFTDEWGWVPISHVDVTRLPKVPDAEIVNEEQIAPQGQKPPEIDPDPEGEAASAMANEAYGELLNDLKNETDEKSDSL